MIPKGLLSALVDCLTKSYKAYKFFRGVVRIPMEFQEKVSALLLLLRFCRSTNL